MQTHTEEKNILVQIAIQLFSYASNLQKHVRLHTGEKLYSCEIYRFEFSKNSKLKRHIHTHPERCESIFFFTNF